MFVIQWLCSAAPATSGGGSTAKHPNNYRAGMCLCAAVFRWCCARRAPTAFEKPCLRPSWWVGWMKSLRFEILLVQMRAEGSIMVKKQKKRQKKTKRKALRNKEQRKEQWSIWCPHFKGGKSTCVPATEPPIVCSFTKATQASDRV